ncbi:hypothetical protein D5086_019963, partial [Populus alba]
MPNLTLFKCYNPHRDASQLDSIDVPCKNLSIYHTQEFEILPRLQPQYSLIQFPGTYNDIFTMLNAKFTLEVLVSPACMHCHRGGGECQIKEPKLLCSIAKEELALALEPFVKHAQRIGTQKRQAGIEARIGFRHRMSVHGIILLSYIYLRRFKKIRDSSNLLSMNSSSDPSLKGDLEGDGVYLSIPIFSYTELGQATNNFDSEKELGDGGFGTVYYSKLRDGREVAVKRLYEHNRKRIKQFMNEIQILTRLRHKNLVSLYGCTSCHSRELLLVYEYIPNGTVADHLHHDRAKSGSLTWTIRMRIAIETATALAYLHATDIIHRD